MDNLICQAPNPTCSWGEIKTACLQRSLGWIEGLSKTFCSASLLWEDYQTQQYANQIMCMNLQAEGMSNVLEHDVSAHREVSKSLRAGTKKRKMQEPSVPQCDFEKSLFSICPAWRISATHSCDRTAPELCESLAFEHEQVSPVLTGLGIWLLALAKAQMGS